MTTTTITTEALDTAREFLVNAVDTISDVVDGEQFAGAVTEAQADKLARASLLVMQVARELADELRKRT